MDDRLDATVRRQDQLAEQLAALTKARTEAEQAQTQLATHAAELETALTSEKG